MTGSFSKPLSSSMDEWYRLWPDRDPSRMSRDSSVKHGCNEKKLALYGESQDTEIYCSRGGHSADVVAEC
jgi:hypothetical protein